jgi:hypothetical protein
MWNDEYVKFFITLGNTRRLSRRYRLDAFKTLCFQDCIIHDLIKASISVCIWLAIYLLDYKLYAKRHQKLRELHATSRNFTNEIF